MIKFKATYLLQIRAKTFSQITAVLIRIMIILITNYCKIITNYDKNLLQITAKIYYKLLQKIATNYGSSYFC